MLKKSGVEPMLFNTLLIIGGVAIAVWFSTQSHNVLNRIADAGLAEFTLLLAQPGVFLAFKIVTSGKWTWKRRTATGLAVFILLALAIPVGISTWVSSYLHI